MIVDLNFIQDTKCGYDSIFGYIYRKFSDEQNLVWAASTALYPRYNIQFY